jgi:hypothetical protein
MVIMLVAAFFSWWYGPGWAGVAGSFSKRLRSVAETFSVNQLMKTLFAPWRRIITYPGASLGEKFRAWGDNLFSRIIGFVVRLLVLFAATVVAIVIALLTVVELAVWPLVPLAVPGMLLIGVLA